MALAKRVIPCLDVTAGRVVKGINFMGLRDAGDPVEVARRYDEQGADELTFLDITASSDERDTIVPVVEVVAEQVFIPLTVGGGVRSVADVRRLLNAGADKVSINTAAVQNPALVEEAAGWVGSQTGPLLRRKANGCLQRHKGDEAEQAVDCALCLETGSLCDGVCGCVEQHKGDAAEACIDPCWRHLEEVRGCGSRRRK